MNHGRDERPKDFGAFRETLFRRFESLSPHLKRIAEYALGEPNRFALQTVAKVASEVKVQPSTLVRFAKSFGFSGYSELQQLFRQRLIESDRSFRDRTREHQRNIERDAGQDASVALEAMADASVLAIRHLKANIDADVLREAVRIIEASDSVYVIGYGRTFAVTASLAYGLIELQRRCVVLEAIAGTMPAQVAAMGTGDLLIAVGCENLSQPLVDAVTGAHSREVPVLAITDSMGSALARNSRVCFVIRDAEIERFPPLVPQLVLAQSLIIALGCRKNREARIAPRPRDVTLESP